MDNNSHDLEILEYLYQTRLNHIDLSWQVFYDKFRKMVINTLTAEEIKESNPMVYHEIVTNVLSKIAAPKIQPTLTQRVGSSSSTTPRVYKCRREAKVGDRIIYEGIQFCVVGWKGCQLMVKDIHGSEGLIPNDLSKYCVIRK